MNGYQREAKLNEVRLLMLKKMVGDKEKLPEKSKVNLCMLPLCKNAHRPHVDRVNFRVSIFKRSHIPIYSAPKPNDWQGWERHGDFIEPLWSNGQILPPSLVDLLDTSMNEENDSEDVDEIDDDDILDYLEDDFE